MMVSFSFEELKNNFGGKVKGTSPTLNSVSTDTRTIKQGDCFVALKGENFDAHDHLKEAINKGASSLVVNKAYEEKLNQNNKINVWLVDDTTKALGDIAKYQRKFFDKPLVAITGSSGKTSVKGMLLGVLSAAVGPSHVFATKGNFNNHIGVPFSLFEINNEHDFAIIEMGASGPNEIAYLCSLAKPTVAIINNVMAAHVEGFGSVDGIAKAKSEIYSGLSANGCALVNGDDVYAGQWLKAIKQKSIIVFSPSGKNVNANVYCQNLKLQDNGCYSFELVCGGKAVSVNLSVLGQHNVGNAVAAAACAFAVGVELSSIKKGLESFVGEKSRLQLFQGVNGSTVIDDTYNANPGSMRAAIDVLSDSAKKSIFIMGDMGELGENELEEHREIGRYAKEKKINHFIGLGVNSKAASEAFGENSQHFNTLEELVLALEKLEKNETLILIKGSRSSRMERVVHALVKTGENNASLAC